MEPLTSTSMAAGTQTHYSEDLEQDASQMQKALDGLEFMGRMGDEREGSLSSRPSAWIRCFHVRSSVL